MRIYTQNTPNSARSHYNINSGIHINLITINNASSSHNSKHVLLLQERTLNHPNFPRHHRRPLPVTAAISHGDLRDSLSDTESLPTNCFVHNIESPSPTNIRSIQSHVYDRYNYTILYDFYVICMRAPACSDHIWQQGVKIGMLCANICPWC